jgi:hypothetical protein
MKQYVIDQLREHDYSLILDFLNANAQRSAFGDIFWIELPETLYSDVQTAHKECQGYYFAVSLDMNRLELEFLIRSRQKLRCSCVSYATRAQRDYIIGFGDHMLEELGIKV